MLSEEASSPGFRFGLIDSAVLGDHAELSGVDVYAAGPPPMLAAVRAALTARGLPLARFFCDEP